MTKKNRETFEFFSNPESYLAKNYSIEIRKRVVEKRLRGRSNYSMLDLGCGDGSLSLPFLNKASKLVCVDFSAEMLSLVKQNTNTANLDKINVIHHDVSNFDYNEKFDIIFCFGILAHVPSINEFLKVIRNHSHVGTRLFIQFSDVDSYEQKLRSLFIKKKMHVNKISGKEIKKMFDQINYKAVSKSKYFDGSLGFNRLSKSAGKFVQNFISKFDFFVGEHIIEFEFVK